MRTEMDYDALPIGTTVTAADGSTGTVIVDSTGFVDKIPRRVGIRLESGVCVVATEGDDILHRTASDKD
jgi:hypothetical protein